MGDAGRRQARWREGPDPRMNEQNATRNENAAMCAMPPSIRPAGRRMGAQWLRMRSAHVSLAPHAYHCEGLAPHAYHTARPPDGNLQPTNPMFLGARVVSSVTHRSSS